MRVFISIRAFHGDHPQSPNLGTLRGPPRACLSSHSPPGMQSIAVSVTKQVSNNPHVVHTTTATKTVLLWVLNRSLILKIDKKVFLD